MDKFLEFLSVFNAQTLIGMTIIMWYFTREIRKDLREDIASIRQETSSIRQETSVLRLAIDEQAKRSDKLYEMYCQTNKEMNEKWAVLSKENNEKWAELKAESNAKWSELKIETNDLRNQMIKR